MWAVAAGQFRNPMNIMLVAVGVVSFAIGEISTGIIVALLILLNVVLGSRQELKARASVDRARRPAGAAGEGRARRRGRAGARRPTSCPATSCRSRRATSCPPTAGSSARRRSRPRRPRSPARARRCRRTPACSPSADVALGDRSNMLFQNTSVTRGTATMVVTATGMQTADGPDRDDADVGRAHASPLQKELDALTKVLGIIAWAAVAFIFVVGLARGLDAQELFLLGTAMAISAIPTGLPAFVSGLLSLGAKQLADAKAIVKNLTDVETLGATSAINTDKTGTLTMNQMMVSVVYADGAWFTVEGEGYRKTGAIRSAAGVAVPDFTNLALGHGARQRRDGRRRRRRSSATRPRPRSSCSRPSSASTPRRPAARTRASPRCRSTPSTSSWRRSTARELGGQRARRSQLVKGGPDVVLARCSHARAARCATTHVPIADAARRHRRRQRAHGRAGTPGARVRGALRRRRRARRHGGGPDVAHASDLDFVGMVGIIDPLRAEAKGAVQHRARRRDRRAHDHRRPRGHRPGDRRASSGSARARSAAASCRRSPTRSSRAACPTSTCSAGSRPRTSSASRA